MRAGLRSVDLAGDGGACGGAGTAGLARAACWAAVGGVAGGARMVGPPAELYALIVGLAVTALTSRCIRSLRPPSGGGPGVPAAGGFRPRPRSRLRSCVPDPFRPVAATGTEERPAPSAGSPAGSAAGRTAPAGDSTGSAILTGARGGGGSLAGRLSWLPLPAFRNSGNPAVAPAASSQSPPRWLSERGWAALLFFSSDLAVTAAAMRSRFSPSRPGSQINRAARLVRRLDQNSLPRRLAGPELPGGLRAKPLRPPICQQEGRNPGFRE